MVDPFLDPLDAAPVNRPNPMNRQIYDPFQRKEDESFRDILSKTFEQEPTPIMTPDALRVPSLSSHAGLLVPTPQSEPAAPEPQSATDAISPAVQESPPQESAGDDRSKPKTHISEAPILQPSGEDMARILTIQVQNKDPNAAQKSSLPSKQALPEAPTENDVQEKREPSTPNETQYTIRRGDTLSTIVLSAMKKTGMDFNTRDVYRMVQTVAAQNHIQNPNRIYPGGVVDLSPIFSGAVIAEKTPKQISSADDIQSPVVGEITSLYGNRIHPILNEERFHMGVDIGAMPGTPVLPIKPGIVTFSGEKPGYGQMVEVEHEDGMQSVYAHLSNRQVAVGNQISNTDSIGLSGDSGRSTGPHLHLEIHRNGVPVDPLSVLPRDLIETPTQIARGNLP